MRKFGFLRSDSESAHNFQRRGFAQAGLRVICRGPAGALDSKRSPRGVEKVFGCRPASPLPWTPLLKGFAPAQRNSLVPRSFRHLGRHGNGKSAHLKGSACKCVGVLGYHGRGCSSVWASWISYAGLLTCMDVLGILGEFAQVCRRFG